MRGLALRELALLFGKLDRQMITRPWNEAAIRSLLGRVQHCLSVVVSTSNTAPHRAFSRADGWHDYRSVGIGGSRPADWAATPSLL